MAKRKNRIDEVVAELQAGVEKPEKVKGRKGYTLVGDFVAIDIEPSASHDREFVVNGAEEDRYCYHVAVTAIDTWGDEYNEVGRELMARQ